MRLDSIMKGLALTMGMMLAWGCSDDPEIESVQGPTLQIDASLSVPGETKALKTAWANNDKLGLFIKAEKLIYRVFIHTIHLPFFVGSVKNYLFLLF